MSHHLLHVYTGDGKGKTTTAMGLALRMLGHNQPVFIAQFMKDGKSGELHALRSFEAAYLFDSAKLRGFFGRLTPEQQEQTRQEHLESVERMKVKIEEIKPALTVLDELNVALTMRLVTMEAAISLIDCALLYGDVAVTGRYAPQALLDKADYVSKIEAVKHPFNEGIQARKGIEF
ncbi:MAG: cob(I)yrinic acid a,c-diamide adenosyltransferase [Clostridiales bacterium]|nr:cob(I)yrinic acid a,c-diamide adenosyltransferase [Clostridiales bacterium]